MSLPAADRMHCEDLIPATQASSIPMALPHEGIVLRHTFTNILPGILVLDFYENYYIDDTEDDIYEARDELRDEMLRWAQHFRFKQFSILIQELKIDTSGIHAQLGVVQPDMTVTRQVASVCRGWDSSVLPIVANKHWLSLWRATRAFTRLGTSILVDANEPFSPQEATVYREPSDHLCQHRLGVPAPGNASQRPVAPESLV